VPVVVDDDRQEGDPMTAVAPAIVHIRTARFSLVLDCASGRIPRLVHWGAALTGETPGSLAALVRASHEPLDGNAPDRPSATGLIPLESDGWKGRPGLAGHRSGGRSWAPRFDLVAVEHSDAGRCDSGVLEIDGGSVEFLLRDGEADLGLSIRVEIPCDGMARFSARLTNTSAAEDYELEELGIVLPVPLEADEVLDMSGRWGKERHPRRHRVTMGCDLREGRHGRTGFDAPDFTMVGPAGFGFRRGEIWGFHLAFSGNHRRWVEKLPSGEEAIGGSELLLPGEMLLAPGASYTTPFAYALYADGLDDAAAVVHRWMRARPSHPRTPRPVVLNVWEAVYFKHELPELLRLADLAAEIGVERYVLDDGWFEGRRDDRAGLGDWRPDHLVWPHGLRPLSDHVHDLGMQFGLWFEPEMVSEDSDLARSHPEWIMGSRTPSKEDLPLTWRHQQVLNIAIPEAFEWIRRSIVDVVRDNGVDYIKWDHNRDLIEAGDLTRGGQAAVSRQTRSYYRLLDEIRAECPSLEIESCSSGGGRIDLESLMHTDRVWVSDCIDPVERQEMMRWLAQIVPPELMGTHVASPVSHTTGRWSPMSTRGATAVWGHMGVEWDISEADPSELAQLTQWIGFYKRMRGLLHNGTLVRCDTPDPTLWLQGIVSDSRDRGLFELVTRYRSEVSPRGRLRFDGLDPDVLYRIRPVFVGAAPSGLIAPDWFGAARREVDSTGMAGFDGLHETPGLVMTGRALMSAGVHTPRMHPDQVLLISIEKEV
jgi:alpha-galactosidase